MNVDANLKCPECGSKDLRIWIQMPYKIKDGVISNMHAPPLENITCDSDMLCNDCDFDAQWQDFEAEE